MLHLSWVGVVLTRVFAHEVRSVVKQGITICLGMELKESPILLEENWKVSACAMYTVNFAAGCTWFQCQGYFSYFLHRIHVYVHYIHLL